jgi:hypothetical protein
MQASTGSVPEIFFSLLGCIYCGRIRIFYPLSTGIRLPPLFPVALLNLCYFLTAIQNSTVYKIQMQKQNCVLFNISG